MHFTILGSDGLIGGQLKTYLASLGHACFLPPKGDHSCFDRHLGHVFFCAGVTGDFKSRSFDTVEAHVSLLAQVLQHESFDSLLYLSSTRVYKRAQTTDESNLLVTDPSDPDDLYNLSKLMGESLCLSAPAAAKIRVVRLSNVYGMPYDSPNFLDSLIRAAFIEGHIELQSSPEASRDYLYLSDLLPLLYRIALNGEQRLYNLASGVNLSQRQICELLQSLSGCRVSLAERALDASILPIRIERIRHEFGFEPVDFVSVLTRDLVAKYRLERTWDAGPSDAGLACEG